MSSEEILNFEKKFPVGSNVLISNSLVDALVGTIEDIDFFMSDKLGLSKKSVCCDLEHEVCYKMIYLGSYETIQQEWVRFYSIEKSTIYNFYTSDLDLMEIDLI